MRKMNSNTLDDAELSQASPDVLRSKLLEMQAAYHEAKMNAAHHKLQYQMLSQESEAAIERLGVEARMQQSENEIIHRADRNRAAATPALSDDLGLIQVHKDLYQRMCIEIQNLGEVNRNLEFQCQHQNRVIERQENELASLNDRVTLLRERIRESREALRRARANAVVETPRRAHHTYTPRQAMTQPPQQNPFAALVQASEMASQESARSAPTKGHKRNVHSLSSLPATPQRIPPPTHSTPHGREILTRMPATAPVSRHTDRPPMNVYRQPLPVPRDPIAQMVQVAQSDGTVSASDNDNDSEAETEIIEMDDDNVNESFASRAATQMLRPSQEQHTSSNAKNQMRQTTLFGAVRKNVSGRDDRSHKRSLDDEDIPRLSSKRSRVDAAPVGLGIKGVKH
jgi:hypothetical protein